MFTILIGEKRIAVTDAPEDDAQELIASDLFRDDLASVLTDGKPLWDGKDKLSLAKATEDEIAEFNSAEPDEEEDEEEDEPSIVFLIDIDED
ncbi:MAG: hypothetical protein JWN93_452 [Hyphomicrobiales bacterium]|nr:hypothetical protein [Hyphomicrobiales bacterium]